MAQNAHPPTPGPFVQPNFLAVTEALATVTFPISKRELLEQVGDDTVLMEGRNVSLHDLIKDVHDDHFDSEEELLGALENQYAGAGDVEAETDAGVLPTGAQESLQSLHGRGDVAGSDSFIEPQE